MRLNKLYALLAFAGTLAFAPETQAEGWFSDMSNPKDATLGEILRKPDAYVDVPVKIKVYFHKKSTHYNPYYTRFSDALYGNFSAWPINARLYTKRDFHRSYPFFFVPNRQKVWRQVTALDSVTAIEMTCVVRDVFRGQPWFEVGDFTTISEGLRMEDVRNVVKGDAYFLTGKYKKAADHYDDAIRSRQHKHVKAELYRKLGDAHFHAGDYDDAEDAYDDALDYAPKNKLLTSNKSVARKMDRRKKGELFKLSVAHHSEPEGSHRTDVDDIIRTFEDPNKVQDKVDRDQLDLERRAAEIRGGGVATVRAKGVANEAKQAAVEDKDTVVKDGVAQEPKPEAKPEAKDEQAKTEDADKGEGCGEVVEEVTPKADKGEEKAEVVEPKPEPKVEQPEEKKESGSAAGAAAAGAAVAGAAKTKTPSTQSEGCGAGVAEAKDEPKPEPKPEPVEEPKAEVTAVAEEAPKAKKDSTLRDGEVLVVKGVPQDAQAEQENKEEVVVVEGEAEQKAADEATEGVEKQQAEADAKAEQQPEAPEQGPGDNDDGAKQAAVAGAAVGGAVGGAAVVVKDGKVVVKDGEAVVVEQGTPAEEAEAVVPQPQELPRLPFFGCEDVTADQLRQIIDHITDAPENPAE
ncbi:MAG: tetratricopeptide repeat protein [Planctomycetota bacterium]|jgi:tetratricopeptide (TPR) repeat protein